MQDIAATAIEMAPATATPPVETKSTPEANKTIQPKTEFIMLPSEENKQDEALVVMAMTTQKANELKDKPSLKKPQQVLQLVAMLLQPNEPIGIGGNLIVGDQKITNISHRDGDNLVCSVDGKNDPQIIPVADIIKSHLSIALRNGEVRALFAEDELKIIDSYLEENAAMPPEEKNQKLKEIAVKNGLVTSESVKSFAENNKKKVVEEDLQEGADPEKRAIAEANQEYNAKLDEALASLGESIVATPQSIDAICQIILPDNLNNAGSLLKAQNEMLKKQLEVAKTRLPGATDEVLQLEQQQTQSKNLLITIETALKSFEDSQGKAFEKFYGKVQRGEVKPEIVAKLDEGFKNNNQDQILQALVNDDVVSEAQKETINKLNMKTFGQALFIIGMLLSTIIKPKAAA